ncbi:unnamed protein product [Withania somnifera]
MRCSTVCQAVATSGSPYFLHKPIDGALVFGSRVSYNRVNGFSSSSSYCLTSDTMSEVDYLGESTKGDLNINFGIDGKALKGPVEEVAKMEAQEAENLLQHLGIPVPYNARRGIFCSRTLNLRSTSAIGYDMDYTTMHYNVMAWEGRAYDYCLENLRNVGFPVDGLAFDPDVVIRGLVIDKEKGNLVKTDRFGYIKRAMHGTRMLSTREVSEIYGRELVDLRKESRWEFLNTLFSVSEAVAYMQAVGKALFRAHVEGQLKSEIMSKPELFVEPDPELPLALLDQKEAGKRLLLITNSDYHYTDKMMQHSFNRYLPNDMSWRDLFEMVIVSARKPEFFQMSHPMYEVVTGEGLMRPCFKARPDVSQSKVHLRWRTALICREIEEETLAATHMDDNELTESMQKLLLVIQRLDLKIGPMLDEEGELFKKRWGYLSRAGLWDKSHLMRQIEKYADIYTSRVSKFLPLETVSCRKCKVRLHIIDPYGQAQPRILRIEGDVVLPFYVLVEFIYFHIFGHALEDLNHVYQSYPVKTSAF